MSHSAQDPRTLHVHPLLALVAGIAVVGGHASLDAALDRAPERMDGPAVAVGKGTARTYVEVDAAGRPTEMGVVISEAAMDGLETGHGHHTNVLLFPDVHGIPFQHVTFDWNPAGHPPFGVYDRPHFDVHFFTISDEERRALTDDRPDWAEKGGRFPDAEFLPPGYMADPHGPVPLMGTHWIDPKTPELNGATFTETFIYGTWDGALIFVEPMITREWLMSKPAHEEALAVPARYTTPGMWPTKWTVHYDPTRKEYRIALAGLVERSAD